MGSLLNFCRLEDESEFVNTLMKQGKSEEEIQSLLKKIHIEILVLDKDSPMYFSCKKKGSKDLWGKDIYKHFFPDWVKNGDVLKVSSIAPGYNWNLYYWVERIEDIQESEV